MAEKPPPVPTSKPEVVAEAQKVGYNSVDLDTPPTPVEKPRPVKAAEAPAPEAPARCRARPRTRGPGAAAEGGGWYGAWPQYSHSRSGNGGGIRRLHPVQSRAFTAPI